MDCLKAHKNSRNIPAVLIFMYIPLFVPSSIMGAMVAVLLIKALKKTNTFDKIKAQLDK